MAQTKVISGNNYNNGGGTFLHGGTSSNTANNSQSLSDDTHQTPVGSQVRNGTTYGTTKAISAGVFGSYEVGKYISSLVTSRIAQTSNTVLLGGASETVARRSGIHTSQGSRRYHITSWSYTTGLATKGGNAGDRVAFIDPATGGAQTAEPRPSNAVPGELVYMYGALTAAMSNYSARTLG